jgi:hypothetical protein
MSTANIPEETIQSAPDPLADPDTEALLLVINGLFIPIATCAWQIYDKHKTDKEALVSVILSHIGIIRRALTRVQSVLEELDKIVRSANLLSEPIWPVGKHGVLLTGDGGERYIELVNICAEAFKEIDQACTALLSLSFPKKKSSVLEDEIHRLQSILDRVLLSKTYGEKLKYIRWSISISHNVLNELEKVIGR